MSDVAAAIRAKLDGMLEGSGEFRSCAGCEGDCYCQAWIDYQNALAAVLELHQPSELFYGTGYVCPRCYSSAGVELPWPCPTLLAVAKALGIQEA